MKAKSLVLFLAAGALFAASCGKNDDDDNTPKTKTRTEMLTAGKWRITQQYAVSTSTINGNTTVDSEDVYASTPSCERDNFAQFRTDGTILTDEGASKCNSGDPQTKTEGNWVLMDNDTRLRLSENASSGGGYFRYTILEFTESQLKVKADTTYNFGSATVRTQLTATFTNP